MVSQEEALQIAQEECQKQDWLWLEPVNVSTPWFSNDWPVRTNVGSLGVNAEIYINKENGQVIKAAFLPR